MRHWIRLCLFTSLFIASVWLYQDTPRSPWIPSVDDAALDAIASLPVSGGWIRQLYASIKHDHMSDFTTSDGITYVIKGELHWEEPLKDQLCILDVNTNPMTGPGFAWTDGGLNWNDAHNSTPGVLNHFLYSKIHGYRYYFMYSPALDGRDAAWIRLPAIESALQQGCRVVVYLDTDAILPHLRLPIEWLLNYWNVTEQTAIAMSQEPLDWLRKHWHTSQQELSTIIDEPYLSWASGYDTQGRRNLNAGIMIVQDMPHTHEMLRRWVECPAGLRYPLCQGMAQSWPAEQGAFNEHVRYDFVDYIREIPCGEATGYPGASIGCQGSLIRHYTLDKAQVHEAIGAIIARDALESTQKTMLQERKKAYIATKLSV